jgi:hypothetical protein
MNKILNILLIVCAVAIAGCIETKDEITVNPDGSGKVIHEITFQPMDLGMMGEMGGEMGDVTAEMGDMTAEMGDMMSKMMGGESSDPQAQLRESVKEILTESSGGETWKDVSYKLTDDGRTYFKGTAYFPDINNLSLHNAGFSDDMKLKLTRDISGEITIELKTEKQDGEGGAVEKPVFEIPEAELDKMVKEAKLQYTQMKPMMQGILATIKSETILHLPGTIKQISNFEKVDARTVRIALDGSKMMEAMDKIMQDEDLLKEQIRAGKDPMQDGPGDDLAMNEMFFGERAPVRVVLARGAQQVFDYNAEVTAAKANYESMLKKQGLEVPGKTVVSPDLTTGSVTIPQQPVQGRISGTDVKLQNASFENGNLTISAGDSWAFNPSLLIFLFLEEDTIPEGQAFTVRPTGGFQGSRPHVHYRWKDPASGQIQNDVKMSGYRLDLKFDRMVNGIIPGRILFEIPGKDTRVEGRFNARVKGAELTKPTRDDVPSLPGFRDVTTPTAPARVTGDMKVKVAGVRLVKYSDLERGIMPLGESDGYTLSLIAELPVPAIRASGGRMEKATTDTGKSLLPKNQWSRKIKFPRLSKDKKTVVFDVEMLLPDKDVEGLRELSGTLEYLTADSSRTVDLGMMDFKVGAKGRELGAVIRSIEKNPWQKNATVLDLKLNLRPEVLESVEFYAQDGTKLDVSKRGYEAFGSTTTLNFSIKGKLPPKGRIVLNVFDGLKKNEISFKLTEITLTGQSLW